MQPCILERHRKGKIMEKKITTTYNVQDRKRKHTGASRNFDCAALAELINSPSVQERVKHRDMYGYFGHWPRLKFGLMPAEGGVIDGKTVSVEPAFVTTAISANSNGEITHESEFLDNAPGRAAYRLMQSKKGGFSSAIDTRKRGNVDYPLSFYGFDYVLSPNFSGNRPYEMALDSLSQEDYTAYLDDASSTIGALEKYVTDLEKSYDDALSALARREADVNLLLGMAAVGKTPTLDSIEFKRPVRGNYSLALDSLIGVSKTIQLEPYGASEDGREKEPNMVSAIADKLFGRS